MKKSTALTLVPDVNGGDRPSGPKRMEMPEDIEAHIMRAGELSAIALAEALSPRELSKMSDKDKLAYIKEGLDRAYGKVDTPKVVNNNLIMGEKQAQSLLTSTLRQLDAKLELPEMKTATRAAQYDD